MQRTTHPIVHVFLATAVAACAGAPVRSIAVPPGYTVHRTGDIHDFDYFAGAWTTAQRKLRARGAGSNEWEEFPVTLCMTPYLDGGATVDELYAPTRRMAGLTVRVFDRTNRQWSIYWANRESGRLDPVPMVGGFDGDRGEFYAVDDDQGRPVKVRFLWRKLDADHARWEQAFSYDDRTWETNWTADFSRGNASSLCEAGKPRR